MHAMTTNHESAKAAKMRSERTCAGCGKHAPAEELVRVVHDPSSGEVAIDLAGSGFGRGAHLHATSECIAKAVKGGLARVFKAKVVADASQLRTALVTAADRRIEGLLSGARRAGQLAIGSDVVALAVREGRAELVVVARDAAAAARLPEIERAIAVGKAIAFSDKQRLGPLMGRASHSGGVSEVAVIAVLHPGVATAVAQTYRMSAPFRGSTAADRMGVAHAEATDARSEEAWSSSSEVR
jgi:predicted RNA-binding protein YlxR (DUF448 family)/ribosomal protein L30E